MGAPEGRWADLIGVLVCIAVVLVAYRAVAFEGKTLDTSSEAPQVPGVNGPEAPTGVVTTTVSDLYHVDRGASAWQTVPWLQEVHRELAAGELPLWNPDQAIGSPLAANAQSAVFDPLMIVADLHPTARTVDLSLLVAFMLGAVGMYLFLRNLGLSPLAAVVGSAAFTLCGFFAIDSNNSFVRVYVYLPLLFLAVDLVTSAAKLRWVVFLAAAVASSILAGMPEAWLFVLTAVGAYAVYRVFVPNRGGSSRRARTLRLVAGAAGGLALAAPLLVPFISYLPLSNNNHAAGIGTAHATARSLLEYLIPLVNGAPASPRIPWSADRSWSGAAVPMLCVAAVAAPAALRRRGGWILIGLAVAYLAKIHGVPGFGWIGHLPLYDRSNFVAFAPCVASFCLAAVAAFGIDAIGKGEIQWRWLVAGTAFIGVVVLALLYTDRQVLGVAPGAFAARQYALAIGAGGGVLAAAAVAASLRRPLRLAAVLAGALTVFELLVLFPQGIYAARVNPYQAPPWRALVSESQDARVFGLDQVLYPDTASALGLQDIRTVDALYVQRYVTYVRDFISGSFTDRFTGEGVVPDQIEDNPMFNLLGVRYVLTLAGEQLPASQFSLLGTAGGISVFENQQALPRAFVASSVESVGSTAAAVSSLRSIDPSQQAVVEGGASRLAGAGGPARSVDIVSSTANSVRLRVGAGSPGLLVVTNSYYPGWRATVNGHGAKVLPTDVAFQGVDVGAGATDVVFTFDPGTTWLGWGLAAAGLAGLAAAALVRKYRVKPSAA